MKTRGYLFYFLVFAVISTIVVAYGCSKKNKTVVAEIGSEKIYMYEFENQFLKTVGNNVDSAKKTTIEQRKEFLDLMIKLRLKVLDANEKGYLNAPEIKEDLANYKKNYISSFLIDRVVVDPYVKDLYEKKKNEIRASHILINLPQTTTPEDSIKAYNKANEVIDKLKKGEDFGKLAGEYSEDPSAKINGGDLYYFTGGMTVPEFEDVVFKLSVGEFNKQPIRTMFGLHIVKITDKKKRNDGVRASHILIQDQRDSTGKLIDSIATYNKAKEIYDRIVKGEDFNKLAMEFSQDPGSAQKGGDLGFFDRRRMVQPFDSAAFSLKVGEVSSPVKTPYGWHIIKIVEVRPYPSFDKARETLKGEFKRGAPFKAEYDKYLAKSRKEYNLTADKNGLAFLLSKIDTNTFISKIPFDSTFNEQDKKTVIATYKGGQVTLADIIQLLNVNKEFSMANAGVSTWNKIIDISADTPILNMIAAKENIEKDEDYLELQNEYQFGLLREKIDLEQISSKVKITDEDMAVYYDKNKEKFKIIETETVKYKPLEEVKSEISNALRQQKFSETEKTYVESLRQKYPVKIFDDALAKAFKDM